MVVGGATVVAHAVVSLRFVLEPELGLSERFSHLR